VESLDLLNYFKATRPEMAVIIFTGKETDESFLKKALKGRADAVLPKLGSLESLWQHISTLLERKASTQSSPSRLDRSRSDARDV
jgi:DNA-binding NarL/FixJ family response regulator